MQSLKNNKAYLSGLLSVLIIASISLLYFDSAVVRWTRNLDHGNPVFSLFDVLKPVINLVSNGATLVGASLLLYLTGRYLQRKSYEPWKVLLISLVSTGAAVQVLKHLIGRARPRLTDMPVFIGPSLKSGYDSLPSGHTAAAFCFAYTLSHCYPKYRAVFYLFAAIVGLCRVYSLSHFPSDVLAGAVLGVSAARLISARILHSGATV